MEESPINKEASIFDISYFSRQFDSPYESTKAMCAFINENVHKFIEPTHMQKVLDAGAGMGETLYYFAKSFPHWHFDGLELNRDLVQAGKKIFEEKRVKNLALTCGDLYDIDVMYNKLAYDGIISLQTLSWLNDADTALKKICHLQPKWIAFSSLYYDGPVDAYIQIREESGHDHDLIIKTAPYNIYSIPRIDQLLSDHGYRSNWKKFEIGLDLPKPSHKGMGTYTEKLKDDTRLQISGPLIMPWHFCFAHRET